jgi:chloramphenicol-sensitive protein RarD
MFIPAFTYLLVLEISGKGAFGHGSITETILLALSGVATGLPLLLFGAAAQKIQLSELGFLQYIAPTFQFLIGVLVYGESFSPDRMIGFGLIWLALAIYTADSIRARRRISVIAPAG